MRKIDDEHVWHSRCGSQFGIDTLQAAGYVQGKANPCLSYHAEFHVSIVVHGDDFVAVGPAQHLDNIKSTLSDKYKIKIEQLGHGDGKNKDQNL